jgi:ribosomal-protein-alanine N-acetyltransferase
MILPTITTSRLILRPLSIYDAEDMFEYSKTSLVGPQAGWEPHKNIHETICILRNMCTPKGYNDLGNWAIVYRENRKMIGTIELYNYIPMFKAELGYALNPEYWGKGIVPEAAFEVISFGFNELNLRRIEVGVFLDNIRSQRVCEKLGFVQEGVSRNGYLRYDGKIFDKINYGMTDEDYKKKYIEVA